MTKRTFRPGPPSEPNPTPSEPSSLPPMDAEASVSEDAAHLDGLTVEEPEGTTTDMGEPVAPAPVVMSREDFHATFVGVFGISAAVSRLRSLHVEKDNPAAVNCSAAIYDIAEETESLRWLIQPGNVWMQRALAIGAFALPMAGNVSAELKTRKAAAKAKAANDNAANDNAPMPLMGVEVVT